MTEIEKTRAYFKKLHEDLDQDLFTKEKMHDVLDRVLKLYCDFREDKSGLEEEIEDLQEKLADAQRHLEDSEQATDELRAELDYLEHLEWHRLLDEMSGCAA